MNWLRAFLIGLFTRHLGTKLLALLLSIGLFTFVQYSQQGTKDVAELDLIVTLDAELQDRFVLLTPRLRVEKVEISGFRSRVNALARQHLQAPLPVEVNERFLRLHRDGLDIPIDADFFRDDALWGKDVKVVAVTGGLEIELDELVTKPGIIVAIDPGTNLVLPKDHRYQGTLEGDALDIAVSVQQVTVRGPKRAFGENPRIILQMPNLAQALASIETGKEQANVELTDFRIDWAGGDIESRYVDNLLISEGDAGPQKTARTFRAGLHVTCTVVVRKVKKVIPSIPIEVRAGKPGQNIDDWDSRAKLFLSEDVRARRADDFRLRMPKSLADDEEFLSRLVLVLNLANAHDEAGTLRVPVYLDLKGDRRPVDLERLRRIDIDAEQHWEEFTPQVK
jgi:hypothetical protein